MQPLNMTKINSARVIGCLLLSVMFALLAADLLSALAAQPCPTGPDCYPWGVEGPTAGSWSYASKANYLLRGGSQLALIGSAATFLIWAAIRDHSLSTPQRVAWLAALGAAVLLFFV